MCRVWIRSEANIGILGKCASDSDHRGASSEISDFKDHRFLKKMETCHVLIVDKTGTRKAESDGGSLFLTRICSRMEPS
jgi:hypothetical protein